MPNFNGVWSLTTKLQYNTDWEADNVPPLTGDIGLFFGSGNTIQFIQIETLELYFSEIAFINGSCKIRSPSLGDV